MQDKSGKPHNLEWGEIVGEVSIMMNAGSDTTWIALNNAMFFPAEEPTMRDERQRTWAPVLFD